MLVRHVRGSWCYEGMLGFCYDASGRGVERFVAERDVVLTYILKMMKEDGIIQNLAFKGGTCIRKIYLGNVGRFSEDLDFTLIGYNLESFRNSFESVGNRVYLKKDEEIQFITAMNKTLKKRVNYQRYGKPVKARIKTIIKEEPIKLAQYIRNKHKKYEPHKIQ